MVRVITIDGPSGSGKGTIAAEVAAKLGWRCLDSGALYRLVALLAIRAGVDLDSEEEIAALARDMDVEFNSGRILLGGIDVTDTIRSEQIGNAASKVAALPAVRSALLVWQRSYAKLPGLVADGRDMGSVVFPEAEVKIFLTASAKERANRRYKQLKEKGLDVSLRTLTAEIRERDERDQNRGVAPLKVPTAAHEVESTALSINEVLAQVMERVYETFPDLKK